MKPMFISLLAGVALGAVGCGGSGGPVAVPSSGAVDLGGTKPAQTAPGIPPGAQAPKGVQKSPGPAPPPQQ